MSDQIGYAVVQHRSLFGDHLLDGSFTDNLEWARTVADDERSRAKADRRTDTYTVVQVVPVEEAGR